MSYPPQTTGIGVPIKIQTIAPVSVPFGGTHQLSPVLLDSAGTPQTPTKGFTYSSNVPSISVSSTGLITSVSEPGVGNNFGNCPRATITVNYPAFNSVGSGNITAYAQVQVFLDGTIVTALVPQSPDKTLDFCENNVSGVGAAGWGWKAIATD
jgi:hypothetical protein